MKKQIKRTISVLLSIIIVASLFAIVPLQAGAAGNSWSTATKYNLGSNVNGSITDTNTIDYYKFTLTSSGRINLIANSYMEEISYEIYDANNKKIKNWYAYWDYNTKVALKNEEVDLVSGTYYFVVKKYYNYTGNYDFKINFTSASESFAESQSVLYNQFADARTINFNTQYKGQVAENDGTDYYKFTLTSSGRINLVANSYVSQLKYKLYDANYKEVKGWYPSWNSDTKVALTNELLDLVSGTYYFVANKDYNTGNYDFKISFTSVSESFAESQNVLYNQFADARTINTNTLYKGQIAENDRIDYYKFTLTSSCKVTLKANSYMAWISYKIYNSNNKEIKSWSPYWNSNTKVASINESFDLASGTYYFVVGKEYDTGNYNFSISVPQPAKPAAPTVSVANGVNGLDVAWGKVANAQSYLVYYKTATTNWSCFSTSSTKATIVRVSSGKYYYVQVQSIGSSGVKGNYSNVKTMTFLLRANITSLTYNGNNNLKWNAVPGANKYQIARLKSGDKAYTYFYSTTPSYTEKNAVGGIAYTYQVRAMYQTANNGTAYGAWSASKSVPTLVAPTVTLSNKSNGIRVTWNSIRGAIRYIVYFKKSTDKNWSSAITTNLYYPILNTQRGATYYVQVRPVGATVSQPYSSVKSIVYK